ncbi:MAG: short-chain dehydrogenase [Candidatus Marinimicrobia bacterium]|mgnify:CR=1 FL=1|nr:short-chain dehydrogenase [Candidatus Neomarinimicrobiota bacterium]
MKRTNFDLSDKVAIVTGGSRGIGKAIASALSESGAKVVISSRKQDDLDAAADDIRSNGGEVTAISAHTGDDDAVNQLIRKTVEKYDFIDIVFNNAATNPHFGSILQSEESQWDKIWDVNVKGYFRVSRACVAHMLKRGSGKIINVSSIASKLPLAGMGIYSVSKAAVVMLTKVLAQELAGENIQVNGIAPGFVKTKFSSALWKNEKLHNHVVKGIPQGRIAEPDEIAGIALYLSSEVSSYTTGETIVVDGGQTLGPTMDLASYF